jgi:glycosyltransferase involved in cell wall biosynthesis
MTDPLSGFPSGVASDGPRIWLDGFPLAFPKGTGISTYTRGVAKTLRGQRARLGLLYGRMLPAELDPMEREVRFFDAAGPVRRHLALRLLRLALGPRGPTAEPVHRQDVVETGLASAAPASRFSTASVPPAEELWNADDLFGRGRVHLAITRRLMPVRVGGTPPALMHWMQAHPLRLVGAPNIYTIHDLIPLRLPWSTMEPKRAWLRMVREIARTADHIVTVSEHSRRDIIALLGVDPSRVTNTYQPVFPPPPGLDEGMALARLRGAHGLEPRGYFLFISTIEPRKNLARLLDAYLASGSETPVVIVGGRGHGAKRELRLLTEADGTRGAGGRIRHLGYVPRLDVDLLLRHAKALLFPSLYEGFGLPVIEAMQGGTAVLTSSTSCLPEVAGDAALLVDPTDTRALAEGLRALDADAGLRGRLEAAGPARAALFSPERYAARLGALHARLGVPLPGAGLPIPGAGA